MMLPTTNKDFNCLADEVVSQFFNKQVDLTSGVVKVAQREQLNPEETQRLVERTNTLATVRMLKASLDKKAEITLADPDDVKSKTHPAGSDDDEYDDPTESVESQSKEASFVFPDLRKKASVLDFPKPTKTAACADKTKAVALSGIFSLRKQAEEARRAASHAQYKASVGMEDLTTVFSYQNSPNFMKFACEAVTLYGAQAAHIVTSLADYLGAPKEFEKCAYLVDERDPQLVKLASVIDSIVTYLEKSAEYDGLCKKERAAWDALKGGEL